PTASTRCVEAIARFSWSRTTSACSITSCRTLSTSSPKGASSARAGRISPWSWRKRDTAGSNPLTQRLRRRWPVSLLEASRSGAEMAYTLDSWRAEWKRAKQIRPSLSWLDRISQEAFDKFQAHGFPTTRDEEWRFTSVAPIADNSFALVTEPRAAGLDIG